MKIALIGIGKMGSWLATVLAKDYTLAVYDTDKERTKATTEGTVLSDITELKQFKPDILINAVSLQHTLAAFDAVIPHLPKTCILADITSVKAGLPGYYKQRGFPFVSVHPMFGPTLATMDSLKEENAIIISESNAKGKEFFKKVFAKLGLHIFEYSFKEHDDMMAYSLTTPFAASLVFAACVDKKAVPGTNFARHMKLAKGVLGEDDHLLSEILFNPKSLQQLDKITAKLEFLKHIIKGKDYEEAWRFFNKLRKNV